jgi:hypothetical protein
MMLHSGRTMAWEHNKMNNVTLAWESRHVRLICWGIWVCDQIIWWINGVIPFVAFTVGSRRQHPSFQISEPSYIKKVPSENCNKI